MSQLAGPDPRFEAFAAREPYFAVLTDPRFLRANLTPEHEREFFASGEAVVSWMPRKFLRHVRSFCLIKGGAERADSRAPAGLACDIRASLASAPAAAGQPIEIDAIVTSSCLRVLRSVSSV